MLKRLVVGLVLGSILGVVMAAVLVQGLGMRSFDASTMGATGAYLAAAVTGILTGFIAGKPIWSADGKIEAGLKAFFGALLALGGMFALRQWVKVDVNLDAVKAGSGAVGELPAASLPMIAAVLGAFFELDNTPSAEGDKKEGAAAKGASGSKVRVSAEEEADAGQAGQEEEEEAPAKKRR